MNQNEEISPSDGRVLIHINGWAQNLGNAPAQVLNHDRVQKILENFRKLRKTGNHKRNINGIYSEKLYYNCSNNCRL